MDLKSCLFFLCNLLVIGCAAHKPMRTATSPDVRPSEVLFLPGVDSTVAKTAIQFSDRMLVDFTQQRLADVWYRRALRSFQLADSLWSNYQLNTTLDSFLIPQVMTWRTEHYNKECSPPAPINPKSDKIVDVCLVILNHAEKEITQAKRLDPFNLEIRSLLVKIYMKQGEFGDQPDYYAHAIEELNRFLLVDKSNPFIYEKLGECYYALKDWEHCFRNFNKAEHVLKVISGFKHPAFETETSTLDTARWIYYLNRQGESRAKLYDAQGAMAYLSLAKSLTTSEATKTELQNFLDWIKWDGGNIRAAEIRDEIQELEKMGDYKEARNKYQTLLNILWTESAKNEINWKIASIDYNLLSRKKEAIRRLFHVIQNIDRSSQGHPLNIVYLKDYAAMCYSIGSEYVKQHKYRFAYIYFYQAAQFEWEHKGKCFFQLALLSHQNPNETIRNCELALAHSRQLPTEVIRKLHELLAVSFQRKGEFETAQRYYSILQTSAN